MPAALTSRDMHFMGGIHATEHAIIGLFPLLAIADRGDVGGISYTGHPQLGAPAVMIYDGVPGGAGLAEQGFAELETLLARTLELVDDCPCEDGCPGCIHSPNCGNGNKPLDKNAARLVLRALAGQESLAALGVEAGEDRDPAPLRREVDPPAVMPDGSRPPRKHGITRAGNVEAGEPAVAPPVPAAAPAIRTAPGVGENVVIFDLETQRSAQDVGGWSNSDRMGLALAVVCDLRRDVWRTYYETDVHRLLLDLVMADRVVGFNIDRFDLAVLSAYSEWDLGRIPHLAQPPQRGQSGGGQGRRRRAVAALVEGGPHRPDRAVLPQRCGHDPSPVRAGAYSEVPAVSRSRRPHRARPRALVDRCRSGTMGPCAQSSVRCCC
jgi:DEAD/DEAH box helicase domain-containing protein